VEGVANVLTGAAGAGGGVGRCSEVGEDGEGGKAVSYGEGLPRCTLTFLVVAAVHMANVLRIAIMVMVELAMVVDVAAVMVVVMMLEWIQVVRSSPLQHTT